MTFVAARGAAVTVRQDGEAVVLELTSTLDERLGAALVDAVESAVAAAPIKVEIDLRELRSWTAEGAQALVRCRELCRNIPDGLHYRTGRGPGQEALLAAYA
jgi:anti-anti-sigma regulatory factor